MNIMQLKLQYSLIRLEFIQAGHTKCHQVVTQVSNWEPNLIVRDQTIWLVQLKPMLPNQLPKLDVLEKLY